MLQGQVHYIQLEGLPADCSGTQCCSLGGSNLLFPVSSDCLGAPSTHGIHTQSSPHGIQSQNFTHGIQTQSSTMGSTHETLHTGSTHGALHTGSTHGIPTQYPHKGCTHGIHTRSSPSHLCGPAASPFLANKTNKNSMFPSFDFCYCHKDCV